MADCNRPIDRGGAIRPVFFGEAAGSTAYTAAMHRHLRSRLLPLVLMAGSSPTLAEPPRESGAPTPPRAGLYRYIDLQGRTVYGNQPPNGASHSRQLFYTPSRPSPPRPPQAPRVANAASGAGAANSASPPRREAQQVVLEELARQQAALQTARNALKEGEAVRLGDERNYQKYLDRIEPLRGTVNRLEGSVESLQGQLRLLGTATLEP